MPIRNWINDFANYLSSARRSVKGRKTNRRLSRRVEVELLEDRTTPTVFTIADHDVAGLAAAIHAANANPDADIIELAANGHYLLTTANNSDARGPNGLPAITSPITILGSGATIERAAAASDFRVLLVDRGDLTLVETTIAGGRAAGTFGSGIRNDGGQLQILSSTIRDNGGVGTEGGGGIFNFVGGTLTVINSTISGNTSDNGFGGGGILNFSFFATSTTTVINSTIFDNRAEGPAGFQGRGDSIADAFSAAGSVVVKNSILASPTRGLGEELYGGVFVSQGHNIFGDSSLISQGGSAAVGDLTNTDPMLGALSNNGGPTWTHSPLPGSPTVNALPVAACTDANGNPITVDQRGVARPYGPDSDIGAVELIDAAPQAIAGGPYGATVSIAMVLDGSGSADDHGIASFEWDLDYDGIVFDVDLTTSSPTISHTFAAPFSGIVAVRVTDGGGQSDIDTATLTVAPLNQPPTADAGGPYTVAEGANVTLDGTGSADLDEPAAGLTYEWDLDYDGVSFDVDATGAEPTVSFADDFSARTIALRVTDAGSLSDIAETTLEVTNQPPTASITGPSAGFSGATLTFTLGAADDSSVDQAAGFTFDIDWNGDGIVDESVSGLNGRTIDHTFAAAGPTTVIITATDKDRDVSAPVSHTINVFQPVSFEAGPSQVSLNGNGALPVTLLSTVDFSVTTLDVATLRLGGAAAFHHSFEDVNGDGRLDLRLHFRRQDFIDNYAAALAADLADGTLDDNHQQVALALTGNTFDGADILGTAAIDFFMSGKKLNDLLATLP